MLIDANLLLFSVDQRSPFHEPAKEWLTRQLNGARRVGLPWPSLMAFLRVSTHPRISDRPLAPREAWDCVVDWLASDVTWVPQPGARFPELLGELITRHHVSGDLTSDAVLAALAVEHGLTVCSADSDFARFADVRWSNPLAAGL